MAATDPNLAALSAENRQLVESWLVDFDHSWNEDHLKAWLRKLPPVGDRLRLPALVEMVKIDLERRWDRGKGVRLESYLSKLPELGTPETVTADLILAEYEARRQAGVPKELSEFAKRFPQQAEALRQLVGNEEALSAEARPAQDTQQSISLQVDTSLPERVAGPAGSLPEQFGRYRILKELGKGGMGSVHLADDTQLDRRVALKVPNLSAEGGPEILKAILERFYREARAAATIDHPNICPVYDVGEINGIHYLTMAYVEGEPLSVLLRERKPPRPRQVARLIHKLAVALAEAHAKGVVHRDLKPANIMINQRQEPVIMDFGLARRVDKGDIRLTQSDAIMGSPAYMSPEQASGNTHTLGPSSDIYSLGVILYELLTGRLPFQGQNYLEVLFQIANHEPEPPSFHRADVDRRLEAICLKAMAKRPEDRYQSMTEMATAMLAYLREASAVSGMVQQQVTKGKSAEPSRPGPARLAEPTPCDPVQEGFEPCPDPSGTAESAPASIKRIKLPPWCWIAAAYAAVAILMLGIVIILRTDHGDIKIELSDPNANVKVEVDNGTVAITGLGQPLHLKVGEHKLVVTGKDFETVSESFTVKRWGNPVLQVTLRASRTNPNSGRTGSSGSPPLAKPISNSIGMELVLIPPGKFLMGSSKGEEGRFEDEEQHEMEITRSFYLGTYEVTRGQFRRFVEDTRYQTEAEKDGQASWGYDATINSFKYSTQYSWRDAGFAQTDEHPVVNVSWNDAKAFCDWLSKKEGRKYRLPTEAEWEYSCRAGTQTRYYSGEDSETLASVGNVADASFKRRFPRANGTITSDDGYVFTAPVGRFKSNDFGLHDMHGNVWEWCRDWYDAAYYKNSPKYDPQGPEAGSFRVLRGGSFDQSPRYCRAARRNGQEPAHRSGLLGFRVVLVPQEQTSQLPPASTPEPKQKPPVENTENNSVPAQPLGAQIHNSIGMELVLIPAGKFLMGSPNNQGFEWEKPQHEVEITKAFYLGKYEVSRGQFRKFVDAGYQTEAEEDGRGGIGYDAETNDFKGPNTKYSWRNVGFEQTDEHPVVNVTWKDAVAFCDWLSKKEGKKYRLPTEAEWEYSCRAGTQTRYYSGEDSETLASVGNVADASFKRKFPNLSYSMIKSDDGYVFTAPVGQYQTNAFGLHDMHGNVWEWCQDWFDNDYYKNSPRQDPQGPSAGPFRVLRGGSLSHPPRNCRAAHRLGFQPADRYADLGFRVVLVR